MAIKELPQCNAEENAGAAKAGYHYIGTAGGYKVHLRDGVSVRIRFCKDRAGQLRTEYRISSRWQLPSPIQKLLDAVDRVFAYFKGRQHHEIPFAEEARHYLLGCQLEQNLLGDDAQKVGDTIGAAQHGQAAGQIGIYSGMLAVLRWAATPAPQAPASIQIDLKDPA